MKSIVQVSYTQERILDFKASGVFGGAFKSKGMWS